MRTAEFDYDLPSERIALEPVAPRDRARLLVLPAEGLRDAHVRDLPDLLEPGDVLVVNDTKVRPARVFGRRVTGGRVEFLLLEREPGGVHAALVRANKRLRPGEIVQMDGGLEARLLERPEGGAIWRIRIEGAPDVDAVLDRVGHVPLPPYIKRPDRPEDRERYQTMFAAHGASAAAPTAGLHFTPGLVARLQARGVEIVTVTLHVGYGTFQPIASERVEDHRLHAEDFAVTAEAAERITRRRGRLVAVGTTTARVLETLAATGGIRAATGRTDLFLYPGRPLHAIDGLMTNFHLPQSSLLLLVCAFAGRERVLAAYEHALAHGYRFYSYGDAMLIL
ncbi:MAG: tRNA preQ1(34) S-adenosylmethionine ribosyltransferase-isomerase QueA [Planctomycetota bacterium]